jgi:hypothetical protein
MRVSRACQTNVTHVSRRSFQRAVRFFTSSEEFFMSYSGMRKVIVCVALWCAQSLATSAVTVVPMSFKQIVDEAAIVVYGRVAEVHGEWTMDRQGIESVVRLDALQVIKGRAGERVAFKVPGGEAGGRIHLLPGAPTFHEGDLVLVFLGGGGAAYPTLVGFTQGVFRVAAHATTGTPMVLAPPAEAAQRAPGRIERGDPRRPPMSLAAFGAEVRAVMEQER